MSRFKFISIFMIEMFIFLISTHANGAIFGTFEKPFSAQSLWNSKPVGPVFDSFIIPDSLYLPSVHEGKYSTQCFLASDNDQSMKIRGTLGKKGIYNSDSEAFTDEVVIPHWPQELVPAEGGDGHADIFDTNSGLIYSFWQLKKVDNIWRATVFGFSEMKGSGWGTPAHYHQGARASGVVSCAGIIRKHELYDGSQNYSHALAMSLTNNALSKNPPYLFPAAISDGDTSKNTGSIPEGALIMLPQEFDTSRITTPELKKIANTLKIYGAYVVDMNFGTPYIFYVENGAGLKMNKASMDSTVRKEMDMIRQSMRMVNSASYWIDGEGKKFTPDKNLNLLSMRGPWVPLNGKPVAPYVSELQAVVFSNTSSQVIQANYSGRSIPSSVWGNPHKGEVYILKAITSGGATLRLKLIDKQSKNQVYDSNELKNNDSVRFSWPSDDFTSIVVVTSGVGNQSAVTGTLIKDIVK